LTGQIYELVESKELFHDERPQGQLAVSGFNYHLHGSNDFHGTIAFGGERP